MRHLVTGAAIAVILLAGCGGGADVVNPPPPPPPAPPPPPPAAPATSLVILSGDNQQATVGMPVPGALVVRAVTSANEPVAGVAISFSIDAGGGTIQHPTATTGSDGKADPGVWMLGSAPGANVLKATAAGLPAVSWHATGVAAPVPNTEANIPAGGGTATVTAPGAGNGFQVTIPAGGFASSTHVVIAVDTVRTVTLPQGVTLAGPVYRITGFPAAQAGSLITLKLPVSRASTIGLAAFIRDPSTGRMEMLTPVKRTADGFTVASAHLSTDLMLNSSSAAGLRHAASLRAGGPIEVVTIEAAESLIVHGTDSGFRPGVDDWEFPNWGSYIASGGHCAGQSISALWYYLRRKPTEGQLFRRFDELSTIWQDNRGGYRFASTVQQTIDWDRRKEYFDLIEVLSSATELGLDRLHYDAGALAILSTGEPQYVELSNAHAGHAIVLYRTDQTHLYVADPNYPGMSRAIDFNGTTFTPFPAQSHAGAASEAYPTIRVAGTTVVIPTGDLDPLWPQIAAGTIGSDKFPAFSMEYLDLLTNTWTALPDSLAIRQDVLQVRAICPTCSGGLVPPPGETVPGKVEWVQEWNSTGTPVGNSGDVAGQTTSGTSAPLFAGFQRIGAAIMANDATGTWSYVDWKWIKVLSTPFGITPFEDHIDVNTTLDMAAQPNGNVPAQAKYLWDFNDGTAPVAVINDSTVQHQFTTGGVRAVSVELWDNTANKRLARAVASIEVKESLTVWTIDTMSGTAPAWSPVDPQTSDDYAKQAAYFTKIVQHLGTATIQYLDPPGNPGGATIRIVMPTSNPSALILGYIGTMCDEDGKLDWIGLPTNGTLAAVGRSNFCLTGASAGLHVWPEVPAINAVGVGNRLTGTITITYRDFDRINNFHVPRDVKVVMYKFSAVR